MTDATLAIAYLRSRWFKLVDLDRAQEIEVIHRLGVSLRELAAALNCSPSLLTRLLQAAHASVKDRELARQGVLSTRSLARRSKAEGAGSTAVRGEEFAFERERTALQGSRSILKWLSEQHIANGDQCLFIESARQKLSSKEPAGTTSADQMMVQSILGDSKPEEVNIDASLVRCLEIWAFHGIPDALVRQRAFELVIDELDLRSSCGALIDRKIATPQMGPMAIAA